VVNRKGTDNAMAKRDLQKLQIEKHKPHYIYSAVRYHGGKPLSY